MCRRVETLTGAVATVGRGMLCDMAPDGSYIVVCRARAVWKIEAASLKATRIHKKYCRPAISPSGRCAAWIHRDYGVPGHVQFRRTDDWSLVASSPGMEPQPASSNMIHWVTEEVQRPAGPAE